ELVELAEVAARLHQVLPAAEAFALDVQLREPRGAARPHVDGQARLVIPAVRGVEREKAAEVAGVSSRHDDDERGELLQLVLLPREPQVVVLAVEAYHGRV